jgi:hypothetical protein
MLNIRSLTNSLNPYDVLMTIFLDAAALETVSYNFGLKAIKTSVDIDFARLIAVFFTQEPVQAVVIFLHLVLVSFSCIAALRFPVRETPDLLSALFEAANAAVLAAFINIFLLGNPEPFRDNLTLALAAAGLFFLCRWMLPKSPLKVRIPLGGVLLSLFWLLSIIIVVRFYIIRGQFMSPATINDYTIFKDALCLWAILFTIGLIPQLDQMASSYKYAIFLFAGLLTLLALFLEIQFPHTDIAKSFAIDILRNKNLPEELNTILRRSMLGHVTLRSFCLLFVGVVVTFGVGFFRRKGKWLQI